MDNSKSKSDSQGSGKKRFSRRKKIILGIIVSLAVILITGVSVVGSMLFDPPEKFDVTPLSEDSRQRCSQLFEQVMMKAMQSKPGQVAEITLSPEDVNAIIDATENADNFKQMIFGGKLDVSKINYKADYDKGRFNVVFIANTKIYTPFGSHVKIGFSCTPVVAEKYETVTVHSAEFGSISIPAAQVEADFIKELERRKTNKYYVFARKVVISTKINPDYSITITYRPNELREVVAEQFMKNMFN